MKTLIKTLFWILISVISLWAGVPEPGLMLYGLVECENGSVRLTSGEICLTLSDPQGKTLQVTSSIEDINKKYSYALQVPFESAVYDMPANPNAFLLKETDTEYSLVQVKITVDNQVATLLSMSSSKVTMSQRERGKIQRIDFQLDITLKDSDGDGMPDAWEEKNGLNPFENKDETLDSDGDDRNNVQEYHDGTDPFLPNREFSYALALTNHSEIEYSRTLAWNWKDATALKGMTGYQYRFNGAGDWTESAVNALTVQNLPVQRNQFLEVRVKVWSVNQVVYSTPEKDIFGIDASTINLTGLTVNNGGFATADTAVSLSISFSCIGENEILQVLVKVDEGAVQEMAYSPENNYSVALPDKIGFHKIVVKVKDKNGEQSNELDSRIYSSRHVNSLSAVMAGVEEASLTELRGLFTLKASGENNVFTFASVPDGVYGLHVKKTSGVDAFESRIWLKDGEALNLGTLNTASSAFPLQGVTNPAVSGLEVVAGKDLGYGLFLPVEKTVTGENGQFSFSGLAQGKWSFYVRDLSPEGRRVSTTQVFSVGANSNNQMTLSLEAGHKLSGKVNAPESLILLTDQNLNFYRAYAGANGEYALNVPSGEYKRITLCEAFESKAEPLSVFQDTVSDIALPEASVTLSGTISGSQHLLASNPALKISVQLLEKAGFSDFGWIRHFEKNPSVSELAWNLYKTETLPPEDLLFLEILEDAGRGIHTMNRVNAQNSGNHFTVLSPGGNVKGSVFMKGEAVASAQVFLFDRENRIYGLCSGSAQGEFLFRNLSPQEGYYLKTLLPNGVSVQSEAFALSDNEELTVDLTWAEELTLTLAEYPQEIERNKAVSLKVNYANMEVSKGYVLAAELSRTDGEGVFGQAEQAVPDEAGSLTLQFNVAEEAPASNAYQFKITCKRNSGQTWETLKIIKSPNDIRLKEEEAPDPVIQIRAYDLKRKAGEAYQFRLFAEHVDKNECTLSAKLIHATSNTLIFQNSYALRDPVPGEALYELALPSGLAACSSVYLKLELLKKTDNTRILSVQTDSNIVLEASSTPPPGNDLIPEISLISSKSILHKGETATLYIQVQGSEIYGIDADVVFNKDHLTVTNSNYEDFLPTEHRLQIPARVSQANGTVKLAASLMNPAPAKSGKGIFATFSVKANVSLDMATTLSCNVLLSDRYGNKIIYEKNILQLTLKSDTPTPPPAGDKVISGTIYDSNNKPAEGVTVVITKMKTDPQTGLLVVVENEEGAPVQFEVKTDASGKFVADALPALAEGESYEVKATTADGYFITPVQVDNINNPVVINAVHLLLGDINSDKVIDIGDFTIMAAAYGLKNGQYGYKKQADLNKDELVNIQDLTILGGNFGMRS